MCSGPCQSIRHQGSNRWRRLFRKRRKWSGPRNIPTCSHCLTQRRKGRKVFRLAVSRRRTRIRFPCLTQRRKDAKKADRGGDRTIVSRKGAKTQREEGFLFSSQPEAYQDRFSMSHAKTQREEGFLFSSQPEAYQDSIPMSHAKAQRRKGRKVFRLAVSRRRTRIDSPCLTQRRKEDRQGREIIFGCFLFCLFWVGIPFAFLAS